MTSLKRCPSNDSHDEFYTVAHVMQDWKVSADGTFIEQNGADLQVSFPPDTGNIWRCVTCGAEGVTP